ncbi:MAG: hypothetical protein RQ760_09425 [Sedimentisphaerales bacterium]|nr:hypothetical protein [Sedimentisphaerales bacterium]
MKRILLISLILGLCAGQSYAGYYVPNQATVSTMDLQGTGTNTIMNSSLSVYNDSPSVGSTTFTASMMYTLDGGLTRTYGLASTSIGLTSLSLDLTSYTGFAMDLQNTNDDEWFVKLYIKGTDLDATSGMVSLLPNTSSTLLAIDFTGLNVADVTDIGFRVFGNMDSSPLSNLINPSNGDEFGVAVVPIPETILLGLLGLGMGGWKLRKKRNCFTALAKK